jgi:signal transduction histidine kinase/integral membrane sensor domain MASE1/CheY-like chemotaxis protein
VSDLARPRTPLRQAIATIAVALLYFCAAKLGLSLAIIADQVTAVWPATGLALAAVMVWGSWLGPGIWLGAFLANFTTGVSVLTASGMATGNTAEALLGAWLLRRVASADLPLPRLRDVVSLVVLCAFFSTMVSATIGVLSLCLSGMQPWSAFQSLWWVWWLGDSTSDLLVAPVLLTWRRHSRPIRTPGSLLEGAVLVATAIAVASVVFTGSVSALAGNHPLEFTIFPIVIWAALRFGQPVTATATLVIAAIAVLGTARGYGPFGGVPVHQNIILLQIFLSVVATTGLILAAAIRERDAAEARQAASYAIGQTLAETSSLDEATPRILRTICKTLDWDLGNIWKMDPASGDLVFVASWSKPGTHAPGFLEMTRASRFGPGIGLPGRVWTTGAPAWIRDVAEDGNFPRAGIATREGLHSAFGFPITLGADVPAVIEFFSSEIRRPDAELLRMFGAIGSHIGQFLERRRVEEERADLLVRERNARTAAEAADRLKDEFLATVSHELRTPLNAIVGWATLLTSGSLDEARARAAVQTIKRNADMQAKIVDDILDVSRIITGKLGLQIETVDLPFVVRAAVDAIRPAADAKGIELAVTVEPAVQPISGDAQRLQQVFWNLLTNAVKFTPRGGRVSVALSRTGDEIDMAVVDTGMGVKPDFLPYVFDRFRQHDSSTTRAHGGIGLGLAIVRHIVELHGGWVAAANNADGKGARFSVTLPIRAHAKSGASRPDVETGRDQTLAAVTGLLEGLEVLAVDDDADARELVAAMLGRDGARVVTACSVDEAMVCFEQRRPHVVVADIGMPGQDGYSLLDRIRKAEPTGSPRVPVVALTAYARPEDRTRALAAGFQEHAAKPVDGDALARIVARLGQISGV